MWLGQAMGTKAQTSARFTEDSYWESSMLLACMKLNYGEQMNSWGQRFAHWGHVQWKTATEFGRSCNVLYILFIFFVCIKGTKRLLDPKGLVLVHDNDVLYLLRYAPVSSFSDPPPPLPFQNEQLNG